MMEPDEKDIIYKIRKGEIDVNNQQLFMSTLIKVLIWNLNQVISIRGITVPHYIINTGDDIMYLEVKGQDHSIEPLEVSNEDFVYSTIPRCLVTPRGITIPTDDLTSPYSNGMFQYDNGDNIYSYTAEWRRIPLEISVGLKYYFDSYTDVLEGVQQILTHCAFVNTFDIQYLGQTIKSSYKITDSLEGEYQVEFDGITTDSKYRVIDTEITVESNLPVIYPKTAILGHMFVKEPVSLISVPGDPARSIDTILRCKNCANYEREDDEGHEYICPRYSFYKTDAEFLACPEHEEKTE